MLISIASIKGSPGVTSTSLALASVWSSTTGRAAVLLESDPAGGDLAYRAESTGGGPPSESPSLTTLGADVRQHSRTGAESAVARQAQQLACGVRLVPGLLSATQARGLESLWPSIATAAARSSEDVIADLGRLDPGNPALPLAQRSDVLVLVVGASMGSVLHLRNALNALSAAVNAFDFVPVVPVLVGPARTATRDCSEVDAVLASAGAPIHPTRPLAYDPSSLEKLLGGTSPDRLSRSALMKTSRALAAGLVDVADVADVVPAAPASGSSTVAAAPGERSPAADETGQAGQAGQLGQVGQVGEPGRTARGLGARL